MYTYVCVHTLNYIKTSLFTLKPQNIRLAKTKDLKCNVWIYIHPLISMQILLYPDNVSVYISELVYHTVVHCHPSSNHVHVLIELNYIMNHDGGS